jgi:anti-sigma factor RsiW
MRCREAEGLLAPQISESLDAAAQRDLALHLESCAACRARLQQEYELDRLVVAAVSAETPAADAVVSRIERALDSKPVGRAVFFQRRWPVFAGAAAMVLLAAMAISRFAGSSSMHLLCLDAVDDHRSEVVLQEPRHWHTTPTEINDLVRRTVPGTQVPQTVAGLSLQKGRICGLLQATALHLVYGSGSQQVSVFFMLQRELPSDSLPSLTAASPVHLENDSGIAVASFAQDGMGIVVVGGPSIAPHVADQLAHSL